jgi:hypothetical protein
MTTPPAGSSIERAELASMLAAGDDVRILDVRRAPAFEKNPVLLPGAVRVLPDALAAWAARSSTARSLPVVVHCVYGHEVTKAPRPNFGLWVSTRGFCKAASASGKHAVDSPLSCASRLESTICQRRRCKH